MDFESDLEAGDSLVEWVGKSSVEEPSLSCMRKIMQRYPGALEKSIEILLMAVRKNRSLALASYLVDLCPLDVSLEEQTKILKHAWKPDVGTMNPEVVRCILKRWPQAAATPEAFLKGTTGLWDFSHDPNDLHGIICCIVNVAPQTLLHLDEDGDTAYHHIVEYRWRRARFLLSRLVKEFPSIATVRNSVGETMLHVLAYGFFEELRNCDGSQQSQQRIASDVMGLIRAIVKASPECLRVEEQCKRQLPIYSWLSDVAIRCARDYSDTFSCFHQMLQLFVEAYPESIHHKDHRSRTPLQFTIECVGNRGIPWGRDVLFVLCGPSEKTTGRLLQAMISVNCCTNSVHRWFVQNDDNNEGNNWLHMLCQVGVHAHGMEFILFWDEWKKQAGFDADSSGVTVRDLIQVANYAGELPFHCGCMAPKGSMDPEALLELAKVHPDCVSVTVQGQWPLHILLQHNPMAEACLCYLATEGMQALGLPDCQGVLPFLKAAEGSSLTTLFHFLLLNPEVMLASVIQSR